MVMIEIESNDTLAVNDNDNDNEKISNDPNPVYHTIL